MYDSTAHIYYPIFILTCLPSFWNETPKTKKNKIGLALQFYLFLSLLMVRLKVVGLTVFTPAFPLYLFFPPWLGFSTKCVGLFVYTYTLQCCSVLCHCSIIIFFCCCGRNTVNSSRVVWCCHLNIRHIFWYSFVYDVQPVCGCEIDKKLSKNSCHCNLFVGNFSILRAQLLHSGGLQYITVGGLTMWLCISDICSLLIGCDKSCDIS